MGAHWKIIIGLWVIASVFGCTSAVGPTANRAIQPHGADDYFALFSWKRAGGNYDFALVPIDQEKAFIAGFKSGRQGVGGLSRLKALVAKLPSESLIVWRDARDIGLELPPPRYIDDVVGFARSKNIRVQLNPTLYE